MPPIDNKRIIGISIVSAAILLGGLTACGKSDTAASLVAEAKQFQIKGDSKSAIIQLKNAVVKSPEDGEVRMALGTLYNETDDPVSAEKELRKAQSLGVPPARVLPALLAALAAQQQHQKLLTESEAGAAQGNLDVAILRGDAWLATGQPEKAKEAYQQMLSAHDDNPRALVGMARYALSQKDVEGGRAFAQKAVAGKVQDAEAWLFMGDLLRAEGKTAEAIAAYDKVLALKPTHRSAHIEKAYVEISTAKYDAAKLDLEAARKTTPNSLLVMYTQALLDFSQGKPALAKESVLKVLRVAPDHLPTILLAGAIEAGLGANQQAEQYLRKYLEKNPRNVYARKLLIGTLVKQGQTQEAVAALNPLLAEADKDPGLLALAGEVFMQTREFGKAAGYFEKASALAPQAAKLRTALAMSKLAQGDSEGAVSELERSAKLDVKDIQAGTLLVLTELRLKHFDKALVGVKALEAAQPADPVVQNLKGGVYLAKGDQVNARVSFERALTLKSDYLPAVTNLAQMSVRENKPDEAKKRFEAFLEKDKKNVEVMNNLANLAAKANKPAEATQWLERAQAENPDAIEPALRLSAHYMGSAQAPKALTLLRKLQVAQPKSPEVLNLLGQAQALNDDLPGALESYSKLSGLVPKSGLPHMRIAAVHMAMKNPTAVVDDLKKALALEPNLLEAQSAQAEMALGAGKFEQAAAIAKTVQQQRPAEAAGFVMEGNVYVAQGKPALAQRPFEQAYALGKSGVQMIKLHSVLHAGGKDKEAGVLMAQWLQAHPGDPQVTLYQAELDLSNKQYKAGADKLEALLKQTPKNTAALNNLAWTYQQLKDPRALKTAEQAFELAGSSPAVMDTLGWLLVEQGDAKRGLGLLQKAVGAAPTASDIRFHLAQALLKSGDKAGARKELEALVADKRFAHGGEARALLKPL